LSFSLYLQCYRICIHFCHCLIKRLLNASASTAYTDSCDCFANYITNMNYNIRLTVISINCKNCSIGCLYNLFLRFPPLRFGAGFSSLAFSVAKCEKRRRWQRLNWRELMAIRQPLLFLIRYIGNACMTRKRTEIKLITGKLSLPVNCRRVRKTWANWNESEWMWLTVYNPATYSLYTVHA